MSYVSFEPCTINFEGQSKRGVRARCMHCGRKEVLANKMRKERMVGIVEGLSHTNSGKLSWRVGKNLHNNVCPGLRNHGRRLYPPIKLFLCLLRLPQHLGDYTRMGRIIFHDWMKDVYGVGINRLLKVGDGGRVTRILMFLSLGCLLSAGILAQCGRLASQLGGCRR